MANGKYRDTVTFSLDKDKIRSRLQTLLDRRGMTKADLAHELGLSVSTVCRYFYETIPDLTALWLISEYFDVPIDWIVGRSDESYASMPQELQTLIDLYLCATPSDKTVIHTLLSKYANK